MKPHFVILVLALCGCSAEYAGIYTWGHEVHAFAPCNDSHEYWVIGSSSVLDPLIATYNDLTGDPYEAIYVRVHGEPAGHATDGFPADYDGLFEIRRVLEVQIRPPDACAQRSE